jgi:hypothetical protein
MKTKEEIYALLDLRLPDGADETEEVWPGTYAQGVQAALLWVVGASTDDPLGD